MSDQDITLVLENREAVGKAVKQLRREGQLPAVIHDHGKESIQRVRGDNNRCIQRHRHGDGLGAGPSAIRACPGGAAG